METKIAVQNAIWPYLLGVICYEANDKKDDNIYLVEITPESKKIDALYGTFEGYLKKWVDELKDHQINSFKKNLEVHSKSIIDLGLNAQTGTNSTTKTVGITKCMMELVEHVKLDGFHDFMVAAQHLEALVYDKYGEQYDAQFDSGSIEKQVRKGLDYMKGKGYYV